MADVVRVKFGTSWTWCCPSMVGPNVELVALPLSDEFSLLATVGAFGDLASYRMLSGVSKFFRERLAVSMRLLRIDLGRTRLRTDRFGVLCEMRRSGALFSGGAPAC